MPNAYIASKYITHLPQSAKNVRYMYNINGIDIFLFIEIHSHGLMLTVYLCGAQMLLKKLIKKTLLINSLKISANNIYIYFK